MAQYLKPEMANTAVQVLKMCGFTIAPIPGLRKSVLYIGDRVAATPEDESETACNFVIAVGYMWSEDSITYAYAVTGLGDTFTILRETHLDMPAVDDDGGSISNDSGYASSICS